MEKDNKICGKPCEIWSRVVGFMRPIRNWNKGKLAEFKDRKTYDIEKSLDKTDL